MDLLRQHGFLVVRQALSPAETEATLTELKDLILSDDPVCTDVYYEGSIRQHLPEERNGGAAGSRLLEADSRKDESAAAVEPTAALPSATSGVRSQLKNLALGLEQGKLPTIPGRGTMMHFEKLTRPAVYVPIPPRL